MERELLTKDIVLVTSITEERVLQAEGAAQPKALSWEEAGLMCRQRRADQWSRSLVRGWDSISPAQGRKHSMWT